MDICCICHSFFFFCSLDILDSIIHYTVVVGYDRNISTAKSQKRKKTFQSTETRSKQSLVWASKKKKSVKNKLLPFIITQKHYGLDGGGGGGKSDGGGATAQLYIEKRFWNLLKTFPIIYFVWKKKHRLPSWRQFFFLFFFLVGLKKKHQHRKQQEKKKQKQKSFPVIKFNLIHHPSHCLRIFVIHSLIWIFTL